MYATIVPISRAPEVTISHTHKVECSSIDCGWVEIADDEGYAYGLRQAHIEWHEEGCPPLL